MLFINLDWEKEVWFLRRGQLQPKNQEKAGRGWYVVDRRLPMLITLNLAALYTSIKIPLS